MKIGIISDTHDNLIKIKECVAILNCREIDFLIHCGDFVAPFSLNPLQDLKCDWLGVFGNNDGEKKGLIVKSRGKIKEPPYFLELSWKKIAVTHVYEELEADIILCGHTHKKEIIRRENKLIINPGEVCGWLEGVSSLVIFDLNKLEPELINF